ncbi:nucleoside deaminase [Rhodococcus sp. BP-149]|jgi:tRNA(Arg) A34 adenosine deaminase TadA|uniref:nucleoside deaminase n=1 Tax=unclassified Rhodococcus (in: high G+C Gram-positive bacteria) TaxID=192944 RepID=UPI001C9B0028|nr:MULTISPECIES: nucleoside deaminase [unclassified Rhodococcus (in: high G+C Gram-positive bacteria)]MBY6687867.1 nucleoside deaminase [Rhodococcus sp. BP-288]MBY6696194.1 nucleoside deaminase [Rhodococcus sp. BP-188]MBY6700800.1 nucleoside deaminase [Rhodococcus sp. BP-285]MBY6701687.1 nucleoside deaminase [Rhodococcus sp. BP-283]MBY6712688.1 nucleoside deaminase [Rhodococcus sp. BP-160]
MTFPGSADEVHVRRCVALAREALDAGDEPFGSVLVDADGQVLFEDRNRVGGGDSTRHPEFTIVEWAVRNLTADERARTTVYTSGEHCPMCSAAHAWVGLGDIVVAVTSAQLTAWRSEWGLEPGPVAALPIGDVAPRIRVRGPVPEVSAEMRSLHRRNAGLPSDE